MAKFVKYDGGGKCDWCCYDESRDAKWGLKLQGQVDWCFCGPCKQRFLTGDIPADEPEIRQAYGMVIEEGWK